MLEDAIKTQLKTVFASLERTIELVFDDSDHAKQGELGEMLTEVSATSDKIMVLQSGQSSAYPRFIVRRGGEETGITFSGIPGGHEFSSLVLAILNTDGKGRMPDPAIAAKIKSLKGPVKLKTYISLSCQNCPDVVQALNQMAILHPQFQHEMIDGEFVQDEVETLKIQGVPAVTCEGKLISSGKVSFVDLLAKLQDTFGSEAASQEAVDLGEYDVVVLGAGPAGASAAVYTARKGLKTAIIADRIGGQLQETKGIENFISIPYTEGPHLSASLHKHIQEYDIEILEHRRVDSVATGDVKTLKLDSGETVRTKALVVTTGAKWRELGVPGEKEYLGRGVAFCPHCDGPFYKGKDIAVIGGGNSGVEAAIDLAGIVKSVTVIEFMPELKADNVLVDKLNSLRNVGVIKNARTNKVIGDGEKVVALEYENRGTQELQQIELDGVFVQIGLVPNSQFIKDIVDTNKFGEIIIDEKCRTSQPGIYAAGDVTTIPYKQIVIAMGEGAKAGLAVFEDQMLAIAT